MARLDAVRVKIHVDTTQLVRALDSAAYQLSLTMRRTLLALRDNPRLTGGRLAALVWPGKDPEPRRPIAEGRLRAAAKAGYAHVAFEPYHVAWTKAPGVPTYELSARGAALVGQRPLRPRTQTFLSRARHVDWLCIEGP